MAQVRDTFHRPINYLRIAVTDRCNLRCVYCQPAGGIDLLPREKVLSYEEIVAVARAGASLGISKIRLTGGEPLVRAGLEGLVKSLAAIKGIDDISLTTNGILLGQSARELKQAGLKRVNVSLDSLKPEKFAAITRLGKLSDALEGIEAARQAGLHPVKVNVVVMRGLNDDEVLDFARLTLDEEWHIRFIELMPFMHDNPPEEHSICGTGTPQQFVSVKEIKSRLYDVGKLEPLSRMQGNGPAKYFKLPGARGTIGFISPISEHFCFNCNRLRLTADGKLRPCLLSDNEIDLIPILREKASAAGIRLKIVEAIKAKPGRHELNNGNGPGKRFMSQVGG
jgi:cyclic pyranopterin phosphate synthase